MKSFKLFFFLPKKPFLGGNIIKEQDPKKSVSIGKKNFLQKAFFLWAVGNKT